MTGRVAICHGCGNGCEPLGEAGLQRLEEANRVVRGAKITVAEVTVCPDCYRKRRAALYAAEREPTASRREFRRPTALMDLED